MESLNIKVEYWACSRSNAMHLESLNIKLVVFDVNSES